MHPNQQTLETFYGAFARLDPDTMARCYADDAAFDDEVFSLRGKREVTGMWRMLCEATRAKGADVWKLQYRDVQADAASGSAHWDAHYRFSATGRLVRQQHRRPVRVQPRRPDRAPPRPLRLLALVAPGARRAGRAAGLDADAAQQGAPAGGRQPANASWRRSRSERRPGSRASSSAGSR